MKNYKKDQKYNTSLQNISSFQQNYAQLIEQLEVQRRQKFSQLSKAAIKPPRPMAKGRQMAVNPKMFAVNGAQFNIPTGLRAGTIVGEVDGMTVYADGQGGVTTDVSAIKTESAPKENNKVDFDSVILPDKSKQAIVDAIKQVDNQNLIFSEWGFEETFEKGTAISMLFYGEPGTGKTLAAQAIADRFGYKLKIISTAEIETPEPGGAERAITAAFQEAGDGKTVLLFDECDGLVSSRKHMGAIMAAQVNCLLTSLEQYKGIVVFTTNRIETLDEAFDRRLSLKLEFEMPSEEMRVEIWKRMFPAKAPLAEDVDFKALAGVEIAGGHIKNAVLKAARAAANQEMAKKDKKITHQILVDALISEVTASVAYKNAGKKDGLYGTPMSAGKQSAVRQQLGMKRERGARSIG